jgi:hypothetical protein
LKRAISLAASGTVAKLRGARDRKRRLNGKCEGRKSLADIAPLAVAFARSLRKERPHMSYREIAAALQAEGFTTRKGRPTERLRSSACWRISGEQTVYLELTASVTGTNGKGVMYYDPNGTILYKTPKGDMWHGTWAIKGNTACNDWKELANNACTKYDKQGDTITNVNVQTGQTRGKIVKTAPGNVENLTP